MFQNLVQSFPRRNWTVKFFLCSNRQFRGVSHVCPVAGEIRIAFVLYKHIGVYLSTENASMKLGSEAMATNYSVIVNSPVITAAINKDTNKVYLSDPVIFTIRHLQVILFCFWMRERLICFVFTLMFAYLMCSFSPFHLFTQSMHLLWHFLAGTFHHNLSCPWCAKSMCKTHLKPAKIN